ncbi:MAG: hypothetical protein COV74_07325 [Candidatus Omnitrophica bacterium CG11_big_fil_rev_8_21_14_0_20_45_26]|uniref:Putative glutamine amidotransferase domain-containing protein n=1 Tax=Candidatus Abzuiibacterium crystallinum TaxID=1974748 RepID=A0A2H0LN29_9BACT|nr:MAG: hypothetical protein COV74_07325 [Candidatus Omnitrophica bacterium CG11_big_fil_rev_8_21_14_0_20_45_26]PIW65509.1 MAG: hypothetical protein COW12_01580 [Candidatus Omnitrophica bacterium CG12_big_fil_rev_8_21_14_0_65_45_16]
MSRILYLGDGPLNGAACYLYGVLKHAGHKMTHVPPDRRLSRKMAEKPFDLIILSDYAHANLSRAVESAIEAQVTSGTALWMIGGWASFTGLWGKYHGTMIEKMLPVRCLTHDDRMNLGSGARLLQAKRHPLLKGLALSPAPFVAGYNRVIPKPKSQVILKLRENASGKRNPLLVLGHFGKGKTAAWTSDVAPHWCGGLVDWGCRRVKIKIGPGIKIEVGNDYVKFISQLTRWLVNC